MYVFLLHCHSIIDATDIGFTRNKLQHVEKELDFARNTIAVAARAANIVALDTPNVHIKDQESVKAESHGVKQMGFKGKFAIHPNQIPVLNETFGYSQEEIAYATKIVAAFESSVEQQQRGSIQVDGRMIDIPVYKRYKNVLALAKEQTKL